jgi:hypothetical protein
LEKAGAKKKPRFHSTILPAEFVPNVEDCSKDEETAKTLQKENGIDYASFVGDLLYLKYQFGKCLYHCTYLENNNRFGKHG